MSREEAAELIESFIDEHLFGPYGNWNDYRFRERSYSRWAAYKIMDEIRENSCDPKDTAVLFYEKMDKFSNKGNDTDFIFSTARYIARDILYLLKEAEPE